MILPLLETDLLDVLLACVDGYLDEIELSWRDEAAVTVVMASGGYPDAYATGKEITGIPAAEDAGCIVFHAGTTGSNAHPVTSGGRVLAVTALGESLPAAAEHAYTGVEMIQFEGAIYRRDIARR
ncbi:MAG: phosphoribosylglycinamide synthetase C domain-containing protein [Caldilineaceae bacterium]